MQADRVNAEELTSVVHYDAVMKMLLAVLLLTSAVPVALADNASLKDELKKQYEKRVLVPRSALQEHEQEFDSAGQPLKSPPPKKWKIYGPVVITKINIAPDRLQLEGLRIALVRALDQKGFSYVQLGKALEFRIRLDHPLSTAAEGQEILDRVFFPDPETSDHPRPEYSRPESSMPVEHIYHVKKDKGVVAPKPVYTPDPDYSTEARNKKYQGTITLNVVVDKAGKVSRISITNPLGMGLDEQAVEKLETWRFQPATRDGEPVAVELSVEVSFHLY